MLSHLGVLAEAELLGEDRPAIGNHIYGAFRARLRHGRMASA
jgi:2-methylfumaryl-CoA isomerase